MNHSVPGHSDDRFSRRVADGLRYPAGQTAIPSFAGLASRAVSELPPESYEEFFGEPAASRSHGTVKRRFLASAAAVVLLLAGSAAVIGTLLQGSGMKDAAADVKTAARSESFRMEAEYAKDAEEMEESEDNSLAAYDGAAKHDAASRSDSNSAGETLSGCEDAILEGSAKVMIPVETL